MDESQPTSDYMSEEACDFLRKLIPKEVWHEVFIVIDGEIESYIDGMCSDCDERMPDEPRYNEGYY